MPRQPRKDGIPTHLYKVNEVFSSFQGEGARVGTRNVFLRFATCNLRCARTPGPLSPGGFDCDTEFRSHRKLMLRELVDEVERVAGQHTTWVILTGGEPLLQVDTLLTAALHSRGFKIAVETNGSLPVPDSIDYVAVSPKVAEHAVRVERADEVRYVRGYGQGIPRTKIRAKHYFLSPAFNGTEVEPSTVAWVKKLCEENPKWKMSIQMHKVWDVR